MPNNAALNRATQTITTLRAATKHADGQTIFVADSDAVFKFMPDSVDADDGETFIQPDDVPAGYPGRWKKTLGNGGGDAPASALVAVSVFDASANAYETQLELAAAEGGGMFVTGSIKNTNTAVITVKETVDGPNFEAAQSVEHDVEGGQYLLLDTLLGAVGIGAPPYQSYKIEIKSKVADTPSDFQVMAQLIGEIVEINE